MRANPGMPPLNEQSGRPSASAVARKKNGLCSTKALSASLKRFRFSFSSRRSASARLAKRSCSSRWPGWYMAAPLFHFRNRRLARVGAVLEVLEELAVRRQHHGGLAVGEGVLV